MNGVDLGTDAGPTFVDLDGDGDYDMIAGKDNGAFVYYKNTGSVTVPAFTVQAGAANPLNGVDVGDFSMPAFVDIDNDGDYDIVAGEYDGVFNYYENTGNTTTPVYTVRTGAANPLNGVDVGEDSAPVLADMDNDGDWDMFAGEYSGIFNYYENTGTAASPTFTVRTGAANPMNGFSVGGGDMSDPCIFDMDCDGDWDVIAGEYDGKFHYYENTGTVSAPVFTERTGAANPLNGFDTGACSAPSAADLNGDLDADVLTGADAGTFLYYTGTNTCLFPLPIELQSFSTTCTGTTVLIQWITSAELNNDFFTIERSTDGIVFIPIAIVNGAGNSNADIYYSYTDANDANEQVLYYRLKQTDFDGKYDYSPLNAVQCELKGLSFSIYPNPVGDRLNYKISSDEDADFVLGITTVSGQLLYEHSIHAVKGVTVSGIDVQHFSGGIYFLQLKSNNYFWQDKFQK